MSWSAHVLVTDDNRSLLGGFLRPLQLRRLLPWVHWLGLSNLAVRLEEI